MIKILYGSKGTGKTKIMVDSANRLAECCSGDIVYIDDSNDLLYSLKRNIRFINVREYPITGSQAFLGFICGIISQDYDINTIFVDGLTSILNEGLKELKDFFDAIEQVSNNFNVDFQISINGEIGMEPDYLKKYM